MKYFKDGTVRYFLVGCVLGVLILALAYSVFTTDEADGLAGDNLTDAERIDLMWDEIVFLRGELRGQCIDIQNITAGLRGGISSDMSCFQKFAPRR